MDKEIKKLLKKVIPKLISNPKIMEGYDLVSVEVEYILEKSKFPFDWLREVAWDNFFECCYNEIDITYEDALKLRNYLIHIAKRELDELKKLFPFIE